MGKQVLKRLVGLGCYRLSCLHYFSSGSQKHTLVEDCHIIGSFHHLSYYDVCGLKALTNKVVPKG